MEQIKRKTSSRLSHASFARTINPEKKAKLDQFALDIEFLLISVIQGVALAALAAEATDPINNLQFEYWLYIASAFLLILNFWSQAIVHAVSFVDWPLDLPHSFLYFFASFVEVMAFSHITDPKAWFGFISIFFGVALLLYIVDLRLIKVRENRFVLTEKKKRVYTHIIKRQLFEFKLLLPAALIYNVVCFWLLSTYEELFLGHRLHILLVGIQALFALVVLADSARNFNKRAALIGSASEA